MTRWLLVFAGCGGGQRMPDSTDLLVDSRPSDSPIVQETGCMVLPDLPCNTGEKCTWVLQTDLPPLGTIACAPAGSVPTGGACAFGSVAAGGYDNCVDHDICIDGICELICDPQGGAPACPATAACTVHPGLFANAGSTVTPAGACDPI